MKNNNGKVYYLCFYADPEVEDKIVVYPSVISKIDYVVSRIKKTGREVAIVSIAPSLLGKFNGYTKKIDDKESHIYLKSLASKNSILNKLCFVLHNILILVFLLKNVKKEDSVLVYHSLYNRFWINLLKKLTSYNVILQIEDVFSELTSRNKKYKKIEWRIFRRMQNCICVNDILFKDLEEVPNKIVSYGSYELPPKFNKNHTDKVRLVYAGVIEQERNAAFLAAKVMSFLPENYELHILGFGKEKDLTALNDLINLINKEKSRDCITYHGRMQGEDYFKFLQSCDIALSTHMYDENSMSSANYTFPSKVIVYLANNLRVVAQRLEVLEKSAVADYICFYDSATPEAVAETLKNIDLKSTFDGRDRILNMDMEFIKKINLLF